MPLDPRAPLVVDTKELDRRPGNMVERSMSAPAPEGLGTEVIGIPEGEPLEFDLRMESVMEGVLISGTVRGKAIGACVRCLDRVEETIDMDFQELFAYADRAAHHGQVTDDEDLLELEGDLADLEPVLRDTVVPALPFKPVCREDCPGLCSECGARLADDPEHHHEVIDPRWSALAHLAEAAVDNDERRN